MAAPAVASLEALDLKGNVIWSGTGFFVSADGKLITNYHVVDHAPTLRIRPDGSNEPTPPFVLAADKEADLALLKVAVDQHPFLRLDCTRQPEIGSLVFSIGNPLGILENTFAEGIISGVRQVDGRTLLQTSAPISHGSSGGPLLNEAGEVVGITTATVEAGQNLNFAVPADQACRLLSETSRPLESPTELARPPAASGKGSSTDDVAVDPRWLSSDLRSVLTDPHFYDLDIPRREAILSEIDPHFRNLSPEKRKAYLWGAETHNLPRPAEISNTYTWNPSSPDCKMELNDSDVTRAFDSARVQIKASFPSFSIAGGFLKAHIRITNRGSASIEVVPQVFSVRVIKPKPLLLRFEYPDRVGNETFINTVQGLSSLREEAPKGLFKMIFDIPSQALKRGTLKPGDFMDGDVYFEGPEKKPRDFVLNLFLGHDAFQIPFSAPK